MIADNAVVGVQPAFERAAVEIFALHTHDGHIITGRHPPVYSVYQPLFFVVRRLLAHAAFGMREDVGVE